MALDLNKEIKLFDKKKKTKLPVKKSLNLYQPDYKNDPKNMIAGLVLAVIAVVAVFVVLILMPKINEINSIKAEIAALEDRTIQIQTNISNYDQVREDYYRYADSYSKDEEELVDRIAILTLLSESSKEVATITSTNITGNLVNLTILTENLDQVRQLKNILEKTTMVNDVKVYSASRSTGEVVSSISFNCSLNKEGK